MRMCVCVRSVGSVGRLDINIQLNKIATTSQSITNNWKKLSTQTPPQSKSIKTIYSPVCILVDCA